ncbi:hypothetical protein RhiirA5_438479 [Rhizophagus irregularis]|uniref:Uncharacterized protein n=1 Tax=Rhizophagus irregularis TaxID=588596 RepID=A0A2N0NJ21_9GLOM|nr:hypothetical protein RhiirA5_439937 [Rhizophagus irregularis]PKB94570.1 hypothetical protein RhiirA5_438479 [Rhizophagus irregularis]
MALFYNYISKRKERYFAFNEFIINIMKEINASIWNERSTNFKKWELANNITHKKKYVITLTLNVTSKRRLHILKVFLIAAKKVSFDETAHIRWTSSDLLHSGSWESHRQFTF